jgi:hypothetical protein
MISILTPTRKRPDNVRRLITSALETAETSWDLEFIFYVDNDAELESVPDDIDDLAENMVVVTGPRIVLSECWNRCYEVAEGEIAMHCGDDIVFRNHGWDKAVRQAFQDVPDRIALVHGDDGYHNERFGTHCFLHRRAIEAVGYFMPPYFSSDWNDQWWNDVYNALGRRRYTSSIFTEHMHPDFGKAELDETHRERIERGRIDGVMAMYRSEEMEQKRAQDVEKLRALMTTGSHVAV